MGVGLVRSLQPPDILWIHWRVYNFIVNTSKPVLFLPASDAYVRSFLYLLYTLIKLYYTKALSDQTLSLAPDWILLLRGPRIPVSSRDSTTTFHGVTSDSFVTPWTVAHQAPQSMGFPRQPTSFSRGSSWPRDQTRVSCIGRWILYHWATIKGPERANYS